MVFIRRFKKNVDAKRDYIGAKESGQCLFDVWDVYEKTKFFKQRRFVYGVYAAQIEVNGLYWPFFS